MSGDESVIRIHRGGAAARPASPAFDRRPSPDGAGPECDEPSPDAVLDIPWATAPREVPPDAGSDHPSLFFNRELSWLDFNWRVLSQAYDAANPLLEQVRFLSITASNLDEFFMKRVGGLKRQMAAGVLRPSLDGRSPAEQLDWIRRAVVTMHERMAERWETGLKPQLASELGMVIRDYEELGKNQQKTLHEFFRSNIYPILTPLAVDPGHPFPFISNLSLSLAVLLRHPKRDTRHFARVKIPTGRLRWIELDEQSQFVPVEQIVTRHVGELFRGMTVESAFLFRVTRNADVRRAEEEADDLIKLISAELRERRFAPVVRLEVEAAMPVDVRELLQRELDLEEMDLFEVDGLLDLADLSKLAELGPLERRFEPWEPVIPPALLHEGKSEDAPDLFAVIRGQDLLVHHPYDSFAASVQRFIEEAAADPDVLAIKQTLYRTSEDSPIVQALVRAAEAGKEVAVLVEVTARFDEEVNIEWGQLLENAGVHVTYGVVGLKTHAKATLVLRDEEDGIRAYCHIGTGNYHSGTAHQYTDIGILTARPEVGRDVINLFHYLTGYAPKQKYRTLRVSPRNFRAVSLGLIEREIQHQREGGVGRIIAKMNALDDGEIIRALYRASAEGVQIDLIVRGFCRLRPGLRSFSENIRVISIVGRFLEHDRIFWFGDGENAEVYIGSADWRRRNLDDRVEATLRLDKPSLKKRLRKVLEDAMTDNSSAWDLLPDGRYIRRRPAEGEKARGFQEIRMRRARKMRRKADKLWDIPPKKTKRKKRS